MYDEDIVGFIVSSSGWRLSSHKGRNVSLTLTFEEGPKLKMRTHKEGRDVNILRRLERNAILGI
jgi:hypothetical protein